MIDEALINFEINVEFESGGTGNNAYYIQIPTNSFRYASVVATPYFVTVSPDGMITSTTGTRLPVYIDPNNNIEERTNQLLLYYNNTYGIINITQKGNANGNYSASIDSLLFENEIKTQSFSVITDIEDLTIASKPDWCEIDIIRNNEGYVYNVTVDYFGGNNDYGWRNGVIRFSNIGYAVEVFQTRSAFSIGEYFIEDEILTVSLASGSTSADECTFTYVGLVGANIGVEYVNSASTYPWEVTINGDNPTISLSYDRTNPDWTKIEVNILSGVSADTTYKVDIIHDLNYVGSFDIIQYSTAPECTFKSLWYQTPDNDNDLGYINGNGGVFAIECESNKPITWKIEMGKQYHYPMINVTDAWVINNYTTSSTICIKCGRNNSDTEYAQIDILLSPYVTYTHPSGYIHTTNYDLLLTQDVDPHLEATPSQINVDSDGGEFTINLQNETYEHPSIVDNINRRQINWEIINNPAEWVEDIYLTEDTSISFVVQPNTTAIPRTTHLEVKAFFKDDYNDITYYTNTIEIIQDGITPVYTVSPDAITSTYTGGTYNIECYSNTYCDWDISTDINWVNYNWLVNNGDTHICEINVLNNPYNIQRTGDINVISVDGEFSKTIPVTQYLNPSGGTPDTGGTGGSGSTTGDTSGSGTTTGGTYTYYIDKNALTFPATRITVANADGNTIGSATLPYLGIYCEVQGVSGYITSGVGWSVEVIGESFYTINNNTPKYYYSNIYVGCDDNTTGAERTGSFKLYFDGVYVDTIQITQYEDNITVEVNPTTFNYDKDGGNGIVNISSSHPYWFGIGVNEISWLENKTINNNFTTTPSLTFTVPSNTEDTERSEDIYLNISTSKYVLINVNQSGIEQITPNDPFFEFYPPEHYVGYNGRYVRFNIISNYGMNWRMSSKSGDWASGEFIKNGKNTVYEVLVPVNTTTSDREISFTFKSNYDGGEYTAVGTIYQEAGETEPQFNSSYWSVPPMFMDGTNNINYYNADGESQSDDAVKVKRNIGINNHALCDVPYYDSDIRLCFKDSKDGPVDGADVLVFYDKPKYFKDDFGERYYVKLTDDIPEMLHLNEGKPCWLYRQSGIDDAFALTRYPSFGRYMTYKKNIINSINIGDPIKTFTLDYNFAEGNDIYGKRWDDFLSDQYSRDTRVLECYLKLPYKVMQDYLRNIFYFDESYWVLIEVKDYNITKETTTKCTFIKVNDPDNYI